MTIKNNADTFTFNVNETRDTWFKTSYLLDAKQSRNGMAEARYANYKNQPLDYQFPAHFTGKAITLDFVKDALRDLLALQDKLVTVENIQRTVAEYYKVKVADLLSKRRSRSIARPRQMAMALAKELTNHSLPEIGDHFGGRDHTTVIHACRKIKELVQTENDFAEDFKNLMRTLSS